MILHADLFVRSMTVALDFYCNKFDFSIVEDTFLDGPVAMSLSDGTYEALRLVLLKVSPVGAMIELVEFQTQSAVITSPQSLPKRTGWISLLVLDLQVHVDRMIRKGVFPSSEIFIIKLPRSAPCKVVFFKDPDGNGLEFIQAKI